MLIYRKAYLEDAVSLAARLRPADLAEVLASSGKSEVDALVDSWRISEECQVAVLDGLVICIWGVARDGQWGGVPWMLASPEVEHYGKRLVKHGRAWVALLMTRYITLSNYVHVDNHSSIKWLRALGFQIKPAVPFGNSQELFHPFSKVSHV